MNYQGEALSVTVNDGIADMVFDLKDESVNKFNTATLDEFLVVVNQLHESAEIQGLIMSSAKDGFIVGADITEFSRWFDVDEEEFAEHILKIHESFAKLEDLPFPSVAAINGVALGGGFEVTLCADYRVLSTRASVGLPEVKLGLFPGWGGTIRLPRLIGLDNAIEWIGTGKQQPPDVALKTGAADAVVEPDRLLAAARHLLRQCIDGKMDYMARRREKLEPIALNEVERGMVFAAAKAYVAANAGPHYPAPGIALGAMEKHVVLPRDQASAVESAAFAKVMKTEAAHSLIGLFLNDQELKREAKGYAKSAARINHAAVLGAGIMGGGIAYQTALKGVPIVMKDINQEAIQLGLDEAKKLLAKRIERGQLTAVEMGDVLNRINPTLEYADARGAELVVEAVVENEEIKKAVLAELEDVVSADAVITSNTSTISIDALAVALEKPARFCGMHFFNPVHVMPLVEVIRGRNTSAETIATTVNFARAIGKSPIVVNDCPGFYVNRVLFPYLDGFERLLKEGADFRAVDKAMEGFGWPMGPAYLLDVVGIDTAHHCVAVLSAGYPDRMRLDFTPATELMFDRGRLGQKSGSGFYQYETDKRGKPKKVYDQAAEEVLNQMRSESREFSEQEIVARMMVPMCLETVRCLEEDIVDSPAAADMGLVWGLGFPPFRGGPLRYIDAMGVDKFCALADDYGHLGAAYHPTDGLREMAATGKRFFN